MPPPRGRYAPSPTGMIHLGNARTALVAWLSIRAQGGAFIYRLEDLDPSRVVPGMAETQREDLRWLGLDWDEGPDVGGPRGPYVQSQRAERYEAALDHLAAAGRLFPCRRSRKDLQAMASAPHGGETPYPASLRPTHLEPSWYENLNSDAALRFRVEEGTVSFVDRVYGTVTESVADTVGDFVLKRRDGLYAYQLAVVVDDLAMGITEVVRGADLLASTARQIQLIEALGGQPPAYAHVPLVLSGSGEKLSKRDQPMTLRTLRDAEVAPETVVGRLAHSLGLLDRPEPCRPGELVDHFDWERITRSNWCLTEWSLTLDRASGPTGRESPAQG